MGKVYPESDEIQGNPGKPADLEVIEQ